MAEFPAFPLWTDAYLGDTTHLTTIEHGAYLLLLMTAWRSKDGMLPNDDKLLARYAKLNLQQWKRIRPILEPFFGVSLNGWCQGRLTDELVAVRQHSKKQSKKAKARWLKNNDSDNAVALPQESPEENGRSHGNASPTPTPNTPLKDKESFRESMPHTQDFSDLKMENEYLEKATKAGVLGEAASRCWEKWKLKRASAPPEQPLADWGIWVLNEFKPLAHGDPPDKPLEGRELLIHQVGIFNWRRKEKMSLSPEQQRLIAGWEAKNGAVTWDNWKDYQQQTG